VPIDFERHKKFWRSEETDRPLLTFHGGPYYPIERYPNLGKVLPDARLSPDDIDVSVLLQDYDWLRELYEDIEDDSMFIVSQLYGFPMVEAILGCPINFSKTSGSFWTEPFITDWSMVDSLPSNLHSGWLDKLYEIEEALVAWSGETYPVPLPNLQYTSDMMGAARGSMDLPLDCFDHPEAVKRLAAACLEIRISLDEQMRPFAPEFEGGYVGADYGLWAAGRMCVTQEDYSALLSPDIFRQFILPSLKVFHRRFEFTILHFHPPSIYAVDQVLDLPEVTAVELNYEIGGPDLDTMFPVWHRIQEKKPLCIYASHINEAEISRIVMELDPRGLALHPVAANGEVARRLRAAVETAAYQRMHIG